jgi:transcriptional regulator with XRE-family HTH domain
MNLAGKIRQVRKNKGLKQKEFIKQVSEKLGLDYVLNESLAAQWESNLKNRANPTPEQIKAIAQISSHPYQTMWWFMRDDIKDNRAFKLFPNGQFLLAMEGMSRTDAEEYFASAAAQPQFLEAQNASHALELTAWIENTEKMWELYVPGKVSQADQELQLRRLALRRQLAGDACPYCNSINSNVARKCEYCGKPLEIKVKAKTASKTAASVTKSLPTEPATFAYVLPQAGNQAKESNDEFEEIEQEISEAEFEKVKARRKEIMRRFGPIVEDLAEFPKKAKGGLELAGLAPKDRGGLRQHSFRNEFMHRRNRDKDFWTSVMFFLNSELGATLNTYFNQGVQSGQFKEELRFFDGDNTVLEALIHSETEIHELRKTIQKLAMRLIFVDRLRKRTNKKLIIVYTHESSVDLTKVAVEMEESIQSAAALGIAIKFASGPMITAQTLFESVKH